MTDRVCRDCQDIQPLDNFPLTRTSKKDPNARSHRCVDCVKDYRKKKNKIYYKKRKENDN
jgi:hypothetical protein